MLILSIDTSTRTGSAALLCNSEVLAEVSGHEEIQYSTRLFRDITVLQALRSFNMHEVDVFAVSAGPGSFTGLRVGLTAVKAWAEVHGKPIAAISGLEAVATQSVLAGNQESEGNLIAPFWDARRGQVFGAIYRRTSDEGRGLELVGEEMILPVGEFVNWIRSFPGELPTVISPTPYLLAGSAPREALEGLRIFKASSALAPAIGRLGFDRAQRGELVDPLQLDARYIRRSDAEVLWKGE